MNFWTGIALAIVFLIATIAIFATKLFFPYHRVVGVLVYGLGWIPFLYSAYLRKEWIASQKESVTSFFAIYGIHIFVGLTMVLVLYFLFILFPLQKSVFIGLDKETALKRIQEDKNVIIYLDKKLRNNLESAEKENLFSLDFKRASNSQKQKLKGFWISYIEALVEFDLLKERYKTFYQLNFVTQKDLHKKAFLNGYSSFLAQHYYTLQLAKKIDNAEVMSFLNEAYSDYGIEKGTFNLLKSKLTSPKEVARLNAGRSYFTFFSQKDPEQKYLINAYFPEIDKSLKDYSGLIAKKPLDFLENNSFKLWFPLQKKVAINLSYIKTTTRDYHIDSELINKYRNKLLPGDIMLERREWHATNVAIPGYWTHSALHLGTIEEMNSYFKGLSQLEGRSFKEFFKEKYPEAFKEFKKKNDQDQVRSVIESKRPGVIFRSLEGSAHADSLAVLRVNNLDPSERFKVVTQALSYWGKPYDFNFDFVTDNALVCSELIYKAYFDIPNLTVELKDFNGRLVYSPNDFAEKFSQEFGKNDAELELVLFLDGNEESKVATEKNEEVFKDSWKRPKWHIMKDFVNFQ
mgnify:CR=1 FL=1